MFTLTGVEAVPIRIRAASPVAASCVHSRSISVGAVVKSLVLSVTLFAYTRTLPVPEATLAINETLYSAPIAGLNQPAVVPVAMFICLSEETSVEAKCISPPTTFSILLPLLRVTPKPILLELAEVLVNVGFQIEV